jgi:hypothetical protein
MTVVIQTLVHGLTKLEMITSSRRDKYRLTVVLCLHIATKLLTADIGMHSIKFDLQNLVLYIFLRNIIKEDMPTLLTMHGRKSCVIAYPN